MERPPDFRLSIFGDSRGLANIRGTFFGVLVIRLIRIIVCLGLIEVPLFRESTLILVHTWHRCMS